MSPLRFAALVTLVPLAARGQVGPTDLAGDPLPPGAVARIGSVRFLPRPYLQQVFFTPDGKTVLGRGGGDVIDLWEAETGKPAGEFRDPDLMSFWIDQSPDGKILALYGYDRRGKPAPDTTLRLYDLAIRKVLWEGVDDQVYRPGYHPVVFSRDGKKLITGDGLDVRVWDAGTGKELARHKARVGYAGLVLSPDGRTVAFGESGSGLFVWDWESGAPPRPIPVDRQGDLNHVAFSPDGKTVYVSEYSRGARGYDVSTGAFAGKADESVFRWRAASPDGKTVAVAEYDKERQRGSVVLKDAATGREVGRLSSGPHYISSGCWSRDGTRLAGGTAFRAWVWNVKSRKAFGPDVPGHTAPVQALTFTSDGRLFTSSDDGTVRAWDPATGKELLKLTPAHRLWRSMALAPDGDLLAGSPEPNTIHIWDAKTGKEVFKLAWGTGRTGGVSQVRFTADGQTLLTYGSDFYLRAFDTLTGKLRSERRIRPAGLGPEPDEDDPQADRGIFLTYRTIGLTPDGGTMVIGFGKEVAVYAADTGRERFKFEGDPQNVEAILVSPDGKRLAVTGYGPRVVAVPGMLMNRSNPFPVTVWDLAEGKRLAQFAVPATNGLRVLEFTPDGKQLVTGSSQDTTLRFFEAETGKPTGTIELPRPPYQLAFGGDRRLAVAFWDPTVLVYDVPKAVTPAK